MHGFKKHPKNWSFPPIKMGVGAQSERVISSKLNKIVNFRPMLSRNFNFAFQIILLRPQEKSWFFGDLCAIFAPSKTQWAIKWECIVMNGYFLSKHIPNDLKTWPKFKKMVLRTIEIWRKCPHLEPLWGVWGAREVEGGGGKIDHVQSIYWKTHPWCFVNLFLTVWEGCH